VFTGVLPWHARFETWTLTLGDDGRASLEHTRAEAAENSLVEGKTKPFGPMTTKFQQVLEGTFHESGAALELQFETVSARCTRERTKALASNAVLVVHIDASKNQGHGEWKPKTRTSVDVFACTRDGIAGEPSWKDEPQPARLPFGAWPGVEYAHENDDMVVQKGGLRRIAEP
jgi:hypothetical protein